MSLKAKTAKDLICKEPEIKRIESTAFGLQFPTEDRAEMIRDFHEIKGQYGGFFYSYLRFLTENRTDYNSRSSKTLFNLNLLSQLTNLERAP